MTRRPLLILMLGLFIVMSSAFIADSLMSGAILLLHSASESADRTPAFFRGLAWIAAAGVLFVLVLGFASWLSTGRLVSGLPRSIAELARLFGGLEGMTAKQRRLALLLSIPPFIVLDLGVVVAIWGLSKANLLIWGFDISPATLVTTLAAELILLGAAASFAWIQIAYIRYQHRSKTRPLSPVEK